MLKKIFNVSVYVFAVFGFIFTLLIIFLAIRDSSNENSTNGNNTSKVGQSIMGAKKTVAKTEELYSDKNIKIIDPSCDKQLQKCCQPGYQVVHHLGQYLKSKL